MWLAAVRVDMWDVGGKEPGGVNICVRCAADISVNVPEISACVLRVCVLLRLRVIFRSVDGVCGVRCGVLGWGQRSIDVATHVSRYGWWRCGDNRGGSCAFVFDRLM